MSYQINNAVYTWGDFIDTLIDQNAWTDVNGRHIYHHDIHAIMHITDDEKDSVMGIGTSESFQGRKFSRADVMNLEIIPLETPEVKPVPAAKVEDFLNADGSFQIDSPSSDQMGNPRPITELLNYTQYKGEKPAIVHIRDGKPVDQVKPKRTRTSRPKPTSDERPPLRPDAKD